MTVYRIRIQITNHAEYTPVEPLNVPAEHGVQTEEPAARIYIIASLLMLPLACACIILTDIHHNPSRSSLPKCTRMQMNRSFHSSTYTPVELV